MGERGKSRVKEFDIETSVQAVESTYQKYLSGPEPTHTAPARREVETRRVM
jgi:hypothetical protein